MPATPAIRAVPGAAAVRVGDALDFWRVEAIGPGRLLRLRAGMRLPGLAWLELSVAGRGGQTFCRQRALFHPRGLAGHLHWYSLLPLHDIIFAGMARAISGAAERAAARPAGQPVAGRS